MTNHSPLVFLLDVDDTLLDGDRLVVDLKGLLDQAFGATCFKQYWATFEVLRHQRDYVDYLGALQQYRAENPRDPNGVQLSIDLLEYPFSDQLFPTSRDVIRHLRTLGPTVIFSDGDAVFQAHKIQRSGLFEAVEGRVLVYIHKEGDLDDVELRYPADHYVLVDDKPRVLGAVKDNWGSRVTTVCPRFGHYARDPQAAALYTPADLTIASIGDLLHYDLPSLWAVDQPGKLMASLDFAHERGNSMDAIKETLGREANRRLA